MGRMPRVVTSEEYYHITQRGNNKNEVFHDAGDHLCFKHIVRKYLNKYHVQLYHYCFMPNHVHLLLKVSLGGDLSKAMQCIHQRYTVHCKKKYGFVGSLWQGRFYSIPIEQEEYLLQCARYIERNPVEAGIVLHPALYPYHSYHYYAEGKADALISENVLYRQFGAQPWQRQEKYRDFVTGERAVLRV